MMLESVCSLIGRTAGSAVSRPVRGRVRVGLIERMAAPTMGTARSSVVLARSDRLQVARIDAPPCSTQMVEMHTAGQLLAGGFLPRPPMRHPQPSIEPERAITSTGVTKPEPARVRPTRFVNLLPEAFMRGGPRVVERAVLREAHSVHRTEAVRPIRSGATGHFASPRGTNRQRERAVLPQPLVVQRTYASRQHGPFAIDYRAIARRSLHTWVGSRSTRTVGGLVVRATKATPGRLPVTSGNHASHLVDCNTTSYERMDTQ